MVKCKMHHIAFAIQLALMLPVLSNGPYHAADVIEMMLKWDEGAGKLTFNYSPVDFHLWILIGGYFGLPFDV